MQLHNVLEGALAHAKKSLAACFVFFLFANLLNLVPAFYMLNVYDKAVASTSLLTLTSLSIIALVMFVMLFAMEALRSRLLVGISAGFDRNVAPELYQKHITPSMLEGPGLLFSPFKTCWLCASSLLEMVSLPCSTPVASGLPSGHVSFTLLRWIGVASSRWFSSV